MCTASVYKGNTALLAHALATAQRERRSADVLDDLHDSFPRQIDGAARLLAVSTTKAERFVGEMLEIAATQASAGLTPTLFEAMAKVYARLAETELASSHTRIDPARACARGCPRAACGCGREDLNLQGPKPTGT